MDMMSEQLNLKKDQMICVGNPRNDIIFEKTNIKEKLSEFEEFDINTVDFWLEDFPDMDNVLNEKQQKSFMLATFVYMSFNVDGYIFFMHSNTTPVYSDDTIYCHTGFSYDSVMNGMTSVLSEEIINLKLSNVFDNLNGEFVCFDGARGTSVDFDRIKEIRLVKSSEEKVAFELVASYINPETLESMDDMTFEYEMILSDGNWIMTKYELWY